MTTTPSQQAPVTPRREFELLLYSRYTIIFVDTLEEARAEHMLVEIATAQQRLAFVWSQTQGLMRPGEARTTDEATTDPVKALEQIQSFRNDGIYIMRDLPSHLEDEKLCRLIRDLARSDSKTIVAIGPSPTIPDTLKNESAIFTLPPPDPSMISTRVRTLAQQLSYRGVVNELTEPELAKLVDALRGLSLEEVDQVVGRLAAEDGRLSAADVPGALKLKSKMLAQHGVVELVQADYGMEWIAGFTNLKKWIATRSRCFQPGAAEFGLEPPKGILLTGVPGCGKSLSVKAIAHDLNMPLLRLDAGSLYDKYIGATEKNLQQALRTAEALAPSVLWIDEIEKGFATSGPSESDGGLAYRLIGTLATWMQERKEAVFLAATSNNITILPPELTRQGRFDEIFFVDLPTLEEREPMFGIQLARRNRDYTKFDCKALAQASEGFSGAEIEQAIANSLYAAFSDSRDIDTTYILRELEATRCLLETAPEKVQAIRLWGSEHARRV